MIEITDKAMSYIKTVITPGDNLRIGVEGGGCSGFSYILKAEKWNKFNIMTDKFFYKGDLKIVVDPKSVTYLMGTTLDYEDGLSGKGFVFNNPNATQSCGCGSSFSV